MMRSRLLVLLLALSAVAICSPAHAKKKKYYEEDTSTKYYDMQREARGDEIDPWEGFNRSIFGFNLWVDRNVFKPFISAYDLIPQAGRTRFGNFLTNLGEPLNAIHGVLQLDPKITFVSMWRFFLNTSFGFGGIHDFAHEYAGLDNMEQDLGLTLGVWGVPRGPYLVLPLIGPNTVRSAVGMAGNWALDPVVYAIKPWEAFGQRVAEGIDFRDRQATVVEHLYYESLDPYIAVRSSYLQHDAFTQQRR